MSRLTNAIITTFDGETVTLSSQGIDTLHLTRFPSTKEQEAYQALAVLLFVRKVADKSEGQ